MERSGVGRNGNARETMNDTSTNNPPIETVSRIVCPGCGHAADEVMPLDACRWFYECAGCGTVLRPRPGDCCVFCSYGSVCCPPVQAGRHCCEPGG